MPDAAPLSTVALITCAIEVAIDIIILSPDPLEIVVNCFGALASEFFGNMDQTTHLYLKF